MQPADDNAFLPTDNDRLKAQIKELKVRLMLATEKRKRLKKQIIEEDLSYLVVSKITEAIKDPTRMQAQQLEGIQKEIFDQLISTAEECTVHEIISYHRLGGRTVFNFSKHYYGIRLETFYNKVYKEPYYLLFLKNDLDSAQKPSKVDKHTIPKFIPVEVLSARFLPHNTETFLRILHDCVQAFVSRRELVNELEQISPRVKLIYKNGSNTKVEFKLESFDDRPSISVSMLFNNYASSFPTSFTIKDADSSQGDHDYTQMEQELFYESTIDVFARYIGNAPPTIDNATENVHNTSEEYDRRGEENMDAHSGNENNDSGEEENMGASSENEEEENMDAFSGNRDKDASEDDEATDMELD